MSALPEEEKHVGSKKSEKYRLFRLLLIAFVLITIPILYNLLVSYPAFKTYLLEHNEREAISLAQHLQTMLKFDRIQSSSIQEAPGFDARIQEVMRDFNLYKIKVFSPVGQVTFSTDPSDLADISRKKDVFQTLSTGKSISKLKNKGSYSSEGQYIPFDVVETYMPIMKKDQFAGAFEIYIDITDDLKSLNQRISRSHAAMLAIVLIFIVSAILLARTEIKVIEEKEKLHQELIRSEKLSVVGEIAAGVAHEINNILNNIRFCTQTLAFRHKEKTDMSDEITRFTDIIDNQIQRGGEIAGNIMALSKPREINRTACDIVKAIDQVLSIQEAYFEQCRIRVIRNYSEVPPVHADIGQMHQLFSNLISNACHALVPADGGTITVSLRKSDDCVEVKIEDTGTGINRTDGAKIFTPFFTTKGAFSKTEAGIPGTGLGLAIVDQIINSHNGKISFESKGGRGAVFTVTLPVSKSTHADKPLPPRAADSRLGSPLVPDLMILLIDDEKVFLEECARLLEMAGAKGVKTACSAEAAREILSQNKFDMAFLDLVLPGINGEEFLDELDEINPDLNVVVITGRVGLDTEHLLERRNVKACLVKPFTLVQLIEVLR